jgi:RND family efflux transporter MFP subunit
MTRTTLARLLAIAVLGTLFGFGGWQLYSSPPQSSREQPAAPVPLVDVVASQPGEHIVRLVASGSLHGAEQLEIRPEVGGRIQTLHPEFEPGGRIPAGATLVEIADDEYRLAIAAAQAEIAKAEAEIAIERGRRVVAREELTLLQESIGGSVDVGPGAQSLALRQPQLRQVRAELDAATNRLQRAELDLERTRIRLPFDVVVVDRERVANEVVAARELIGTVLRADELWLELRMQPQWLRHITARNGDEAGSPVRLLDSGAVGEVIRIRPALAEGSRLAGVIAAFSPDQPGADPLLLGSYVRAEITGGRLTDVIEVPRRALRDNNRVWVVDRDGLLQVRRADVAWSVGQQLLLTANDPGGLAPGDRIVTSRIDGLVPGTPVRQREIDPDSGRVMLRDPVGAIDE